MTPVHTPINSCRTQPNIDTNDPEQVSAYIIEQKTRYATLQGAIGAIDLNDLRVDVNRLKARAERNSVQITPEMYADLYKKVVKLKEEVRFAEAKRDARLRMAQSVSVNGNASTSTAQANTSTTPSQDEKWTCALCTYDNHPDMMCCEMCDNGRVLPPQASVASSSSLSTFMRNASTTSAPSFSCYCCDNEQMSRARHLSVQMTASVPAGIWQRHRPSNTNNSDEDWLLVENNLDEEKPEELR